MQMLDWLKQAWALWKRFGHWMGNLLGRVVLTLLYFTIVLPYGLAMRWFSDPLHMKAPTAGSFWHARPEVEASLEQAQKQ